MENEIKIMDGLAKIKRCKNSNIWQFSMWIKNEKKYQHCIGYKKNGSLWKEITGEFKHGIRISNNPRN